ncbi:sporulation protein YpjB [Brevibacillus daliensis]|uniref:sporulation protein YpjB n=1 Tax=Brevibacillus daliensis TaxID=2892995 RepID=UPI001E4640B3|nr:sporulation protein YpjB [Brevibacillus daliensis]
MSWYWRKITLWLFVAILVVLPISYYVIEQNRPPEEKELAQLDKLASSVLRATEKGDLETAKQDVSQLAMLFPNKTLPISIKIESLNAVTQTILSAKKAYSNPTVTQNQLIWHATQVRLVVDALHQPKNPLWQTYYESYSQQMQHLLLSAVERNKEAVLTQFEENYQLYLALRPAMTIQVKENTMQIITNQYEGITRQIRDSKWDWQVLRASIRELHNAMQDAFIGEEQTAIGSSQNGEDSIYFIMVWLGALILLSLAYVAWIKYSAAQQRI